MKSLYVHIPFCVSKCLFCSFVISVGQAQRVDDYIDALETEATRYQGMPIDTVYLGGGTPTFLDERQIGRVVDIVRRNFKTDQAVEWTIEANPEDIKAAGKLMAQMQLTAKLLHIRLKMDRNAIADVIDPEDDF